MFNNQNSGYLGNENIKRTGVVQDIPPEKIEEYIKCMDDPIYFAQNYVKIITLDDGFKNIELYPYQHETINSFNNFKNTIVLQPRQSGKSVTAVCIILHYILYNNYKTVALLANKASAAREVLSRVKMAYEALPKWMQQGVKEWNKGSIELENGTKVIAEATSGTAIRGKSCVTGDTKVVIEENESIYYLEIDKLINNSKLIDIKENALFYTVYKITNKINNKIYVGYHQTHDLDDGYMGSGKLIKRAIEKYGIESFEKEILEVFDTKEEAESYEEKIVNKDFVLREDTYNIAIGGNVRIFPGENNPFYGKKHSKETLENLSKSQSGHNRTGYDIFIKGEIIKGTPRALSRLKELGFEIKNGNSRRRIIEIAGDPNIKDVYFINETKQKHAEKWLEENKKRVIENKKLNSERARKRFSGVPKTEEHKAKISKSNKGQDRPWVIEINKNPEKIKKTAEKHRGMKRSKETCNNISKSLKGKQANNKGKKYYHNPITNKGNFYVPDEAPNNYILGYPTKK